jgi:ribosome biogenesis ATPase
MIDEAMLRPGRLETQLYVGLPTPKERVDILRALIGRRGGAIHLDLASIGEEEDCSNFSGADLDSLLRKAGQNALRRKAQKVEKIDMVTAARAIRPSVVDLKSYTDMREQFDAAL